MDWESEEGGGGNPTPHIYTAPEVVSLMEIFYLSPSKDRCPTGVGLRICVVGQQIIGLGSFPA